MIGVCAAGILIRAVAPLLADKTTEPPVLAVSDDGAVVVPLLGGHRGANRLAREIAEALGATAAVTTAGDVALGVALDEPPAGYRLANPERRQAGDGRAAVRRRRRASSATTSSASTANEAGPVDLAVTEAPLEGGATRLVYHPQTLRSRRRLRARRRPGGARPLVADTLAARPSIAPGAIAAVATLDLKADEPAVARTSPAASACRCACSRRPSWRR